MVRADRIGRRYSNVRDSTIAGYLQNQESVYCPDGIYQLEKGFVFDLLKDREVHGIILDNCIPMNNMSFLWF